MEIAEMVWTAQELDQWRQWIEVIKEAASKEARADGKVISPWERFKRVAEQRAIPCTPARSIIEGAPTRCGNVSKRTIAAAVEKLGKPEDGEKILLVGDFGVYRHYVDLKQAGRLPHAVVLPGDLHLLMAMQTAIFRRAWSLGLRELAEASMRPSYVDSLLTADGKHFQRKHHFLTAVHDVLRRKMADQPTDPADKAGVSDSEKSILEYLERIVARRLFDKNDPLGAVWSSLLLELDAYVSLNIAIRTGNWELRMAAVKLFAPLFYAGSQTNYRALVSHHLREVLSWPTDVARDVSTMWVVSVSGDPWTGQAIDEALETGMNRALKRYVKRASGNRVVSLSRVVLERLRHHRAVTSLLAKKSTKRYDRYRKTAKTAAFVWEKLRDAHLHGEINNPFDTSKAPTDTARADTHLWLTRSWARMAAAARSEDASQATQPLEMLERATEPSKRGRRRKTNRETILEKQQRAMRPSTAIQLCELPLALCTGEGQPLQAHKSTFVDAMCSAIGINKLPEAALPPPDTATVVVVDGTEALYGEVQHDAEVDDDMLSSRATVEHMLACIFKKAALSALMQDTVSTVVLAFDRPEAADGRKLATQNARDADGDGSAQRGSLGVSLLAGLHQDERRPVDRNALQAVMDKPLPKGGMRVILQNRARKNELRTLFGLYVVFLGQRLIPSGKSIELIGTGVAPPSATRRGVAITNKCDLILVVTQRTVTAGGERSKHAEADTAVVQAAALAQSASVLIVSRDTDVLYITTLALATGQLSGKHSVSVRRRRSEDIDVVQLLRQIAMWGSSLGMDPADATRTLVLVLLTGGSDFTSRIHGVSYGRLLKAITVHGRWIGPLYESDGVNIDAVIRLVLSAYALGRRLAVKSEESAEALRERLLTRQAPLLECSLPPTMTALARHAHRVAAAFDVWHAAATAEPRASLNDMTIAYVVDDSGRAVEIRWEDENVMRRIRERARAVRDTVAKVMSGESAKVSEHVSETENESGAVLCDEETESSSDSDESDRDGATDAEEDSDSETEAAGVDDAGSSSASEGEGGDLYM